ncbi:MAG TPA: hypothetical protein VGE72_22650 [Azospirillum sp.]
MSVTYWYSTGHATSVLSILRHTLGCYARKAEWIKVGITCNPEVRFAAHQREWREGEKWDRMVVVYQTSSWKSACRVEDALIRYARNRRYSKKMWNLVAGGGGRVPMGPGPYSVYILTV